MSTALSYDTIDPPGSANNAGHPITHSSGPMVVQAPYFPTYKIIGHAIRALDGEPVSRIREMMNAIYEHRGTPQAPVDWSSPDIWIDARLSGELQTLAHKVWESSLKALNPRHLRGSYLFINRLKLLDQVAGTYRIGERGRLFLAGRSFANLMLAKVFQSFCRSWQNTRHAGAPIFFLLGPSTLGLFRFSKHQ